ncbi:hypothetical protein SKAU_G00327270 [Synaphobranchus kaupii]|uniref:Tox-GHH domain-containing protein n=1 Tax=Synaphobranchus kaupii TaxID=118154 RepID=A0A9Q1EQ08_SYNKA|nr:hypothetical protein SKAU_G00327270 [Synaphobranchus kaupii]
MANEDGRRAAAVLHGALYLQGLHFTVDGVDTHYFVKSGPAEADLSLVGMTTGQRTLETGVNVTVTQVNAVVGGRTRRITDIALQRGALRLNTRYGSTADEEKARVLESARQRAVGQAWVRERQRLREGGRRVPPLDRRGEAAAAQLRPGTGVRRVLRRFGGPVPRALGQRQQHPLHETERDGPEVTRARGRPPPRHTRVLVQHGHGQR